MRDREQRRTTSPTRDTSQKKKKQLAFPEEGQQGDDKSSRPQENQRQRGWKKSEIFTWKTRSSATDDQSGTTS